MSQSSGYLRLATWGQAGAQEGGRAPWLSTMTGRTGRPQSLAPEGGVPAEKLQADGQTHQQPTGCLVLPVIRVTTTASWGPRRPPTPVVGPLPLSHDEDKVHSW